ncbi:hypothetical protein [Pseudodesulfovibrio senegalensis]|uniref:Uncharacterized protein n=1 Tax=Pseudodesulfovibrio senegalensis TaxID=1721087 RepID=A0A6N6N1X0_9BACT|nr:hypothetical protein [Pseudodesulfovibrio senegalensis]KAB1441648.1 hypothetical protein F8A88_08590 [Pseudodesulfovibrio senegalensis]
MSVQRVRERPERLRTLPDNGRYVWLRLVDAAGEYGQAAVAEAGDCLEVHLEMTRWGPRAMRSLQRDMGWLHAEARRLGKARILGIKGVSGESCLGTENGSGRCSPDGPDNSVDGLDVDRTWVRFTARLGFRDHGLVHTAVLPVPSAESSPV